MSSESDESQPRKPLRLVRARKADEDTAAPDGSGLPPQSDVLNESLTPAENPVAPEADEPAAPRRLALKRTSKNSDEENPDSKPPPIRGSGKATGLFPEETQDPIAPPNEFPAEELDEDEDLTPPPVKKARLAQAGSHPGATGGNVTGGQARKDSDTDSTVSSDESGENEDDLEVDGATTPLGEGEQTSSPPKIPLPSSNEIAAAKFRQIRNGILLSVALLSVFIGGAYAIFWILTQSGDATADSSGPEPTPRVVESSPTAAVTATPLQRAAEAIEAATKTEELEELTRTTITATSEEPTIAIIGRPLNESGEPVENANSPAPQQDRVFMPRTPVPINSQPIPNLPPERVANPRITEQMVADYIANLLIGGVRSSSDDPRATINGRQLSKGGMVNEAMGLRFIGAQDSTLLFEDVNGRVYRRRF